MAEMPSTVWLRKIQAAKDKKAEEERIAEQRNRIRLEVFRAAVEHRWDARAVARAAKCSRAEAEQTAVEMVGQGLPLSGGFAFLTTAQAAWVLGVIERRVRDYCGAGRLGLKIGGRFIIAPGDVLRFSVIPRPVGGAGVKQLAKSRAK